MTEQMRKIFETYFAGSRRNRGPGKRPTFERFDCDGTYKDDHTQRHWWTWQQAIVAKQAHNDGAAEIERARACVLAGCDWHGA